MPAAGPSTAATKSGFRLLLDPKAVTVGRGSTEAVTIVLTRVGSFRGNVTMSGSSRRGISLGYSENPLASDDADVNVTASPTATLGSTTLTLTGKSGRTSVKVLLKVTVVATPTGGLPTAPTTTAAPAALAVPAGVATATVTPNVVAVGPGANATVLVTPSGGSPSVATTYEVTGLPSGVTAESFPNGPTAQVRLNAAASAATGTFPVQIRASQNGSLISLAALVLTVGAAPAVTTSTVAQTTPPPTTTTTAAPTTTGAPATTTTAAPGTGAALSGFVDRVDIRRVSQGQRCAAPGPLTPVVPVTITNTSNSARIVSIIVPGTCTEQQFNTITVNPGETKNGGSISGAILIARSVATAGNPIRAAFLTEATDNTFDTSGILTIVYSCTSGAATQTFKLADGANAVFTVPASAEGCTRTSVTPRLTPGSYRLFTYNGPRPASCPVPVATGTFPGPPGCYNEFTIID